MFGSDFTQSEVPPHPYPPPPRDCVAIGEMMKNVMLNLFQHLIESKSYETLKRVQGDKKFNYDTVSRGGRDGWGRTIHVLYLCNIKVN
jgi:hypothetical protein